MALIQLDIIGSTNTYAASIADTLNHGDIIRAIAQTRGRGQRGNSWESEPGKNLTFSLMLRPEGIEAAEQFLVSEAVAIGVARVLGRHLPETEVTVKWPNDIYAGDCKICGILIENVINGRMLVRSIAGIGINVNQKEFHSDAPNPVSMFQIEGREFALLPLLDEVVAEILSLLTLPGATLEAEYASRLWRREGMHPFIDRKRDNLRFDASITSVAPSGYLTLTDIDGDSHTFAFKEVEFVL
ncbi:MAG: biotin--[acetyl-CoA-carboxylase] ligase [Muribaculaceae bacterium]|nr:biotin--[acetyl-CoA-carboxylase] ligase [Muribaculaceae bacterium]